MHNGRYRNCQIDAHYVLAIPHRSDSQKRMYFFLYRSTPKQTKDEPIKLHIFSAFPDYRNLTDGQQKPYTILREERLTKDGTIPPVELYCLPSYKKEITVGKNIAVISLIKTIQHICKKIWQRNLTNRASAFGLTDRNCCSISRTHCFDTLHGTIDSQNAFLEVNIRTFQSTYFPHTKSCIHTE